MEPRVLEMEDFMPIGKFKGFTINQLLNGDENIGLFVSTERYLKWFDETVKTYKLSPNVKLNLKYRLKQIEDEAYEWRMAHPEYNKRTGTGYSSSMSEWAAEVGIEPHY